VTSIDGVFAGYTDRLDVLNTAGTRDTWRSYANDLHRWLRTNGITTVEDLSLSVFDDYMLYCAGRYASSTAASRLTQLRHFSKYLKRREHTNEDIAGDMSQTDYNISSDHTLFDRGGEEGERPYLPRDQIEELWENPPKPKIRNELMFRVMWETACRRHEVGLIDADAPEKVSGRKLWRIKLESQKTSSGEVETRDVYIREQTHTLWELWREEYRGSYRPASTTDKMFVTHKTSAGKGITGNAVNEAVKQAAENAGIQRVLGVDAAGREHYLITAHLIRHSSITHMANNTGIKLPVISEIAGHDDLTVSQKYIHPDKAATVRQLAENPF
jgi:integrase/recombinase XerD